MTLETPLDCKEIQPVHPEGNQFWVFIGRTDVEAEIPTFWLPDAKRSNQSILKEMSPEYSLEGLNAEAETPILWPPDAKN